MPMTKNVTRIYIFLNGLTRSHTTSRTKKRMSARNYRSILKNLLRFRKRCSNFLTLSSLKSARVPKDVPSKSYLYRSGTKIRTYRQTPIVSSKKSSPMARNGTSRSSGLPGVTLLKFPLRPLRTGLKSRRIL